MLKAFFGWMRDVAHDAARAIGFGAPLAFAVVLLLFPANGWAQLPSLSADQLSRLQQQLGQGGSGLGSPADQGPPPSITLQPAVPQNTASLPPSRLEEILSVRAGARLRQFGYDQFGQSRAVTVPQTGAVQDDYVLGPGDEIVVSLRGQENDEFRAMVDRNGRIVLPRLPPTSAIGRSFGSFRQDLEAAIHRAYVATDATISIGQVRQISVTVSGEVNQPGQQLLTGLSSPVDALLISGGIKKTGSLRNVRVQRAGHEYTVDLYSILTARGSASTFHLADGDRIVVPLLGPTVAVTGLVRNPGIFELAPNGKSLTVRALLALAGGQEVRGRYRLSVLRILPDGRSDFMPLSGEDGSIGDSEILFVQLGADQTMSQATLSGGISLAGAYPIAAGTKLSDVVRAPGALGPSPYTPFGIIVRKDAQTLTRSLEAFTPAAVLNGQEDMALQTDDVIRPLSTNEARLLTFVVHSYLQKLVSEQSAIRDPLDPSNAGGTLVNSLAAQAGDVESELDDVSSVPSEIQRREVNGLLDVWAPGSELARQQQAMLQQQPLAPLTLAPSSTEAQAAPAAGTQQGAGTQPQTPPSSPSASGAAELAQNFMEEAIGSGAYASNREVQTFGQLARQLDIDPLVLINFLVDHRARINGAVRGPGFYFVGPHASLNDLVQAAGGTVNWADESGIELISTAIDQQSGHAVTRRQTLPLRTGSLVNYIVQPRDQIRFSTIFSDVGIGSVTVQGEVRNAGTYSILRGEHLSELLARAGGLTNTAYPYGVVFLRRSAAQVERAGYVRAANEIQDQLVTAMTRIGNDKIDPNAFIAMQSFVTELRTQRALGRISVVADPSVLAANAALDPLLEAGDVIYIPQRPSTLSVLGQVMQPGSYTFDAKATIGDYIDRAGGYASFADESQTFVVLPDGSARRIEKSWLGFRSDRLPPGSAIVVPRDVTPLELRQTIIDLSQIFSQFAVAIASVSILSRQ